MFAAVLTSKLPAPMATAIEDAVLFGNAKELGDLLDSLGEDAAFPQHIRNALETLRYFTLYYGKDGECEPTTEKDRHAVAQLESLWRQELMAMVAFYGDFVVDKKA